MAVEKLDLKAIWEQGKDWNAWLSICQGPQREELERIYKEVPLSSADVAAMKALSRPVHVLALAEDWCGDVRRNVPVLARLAAENPQMLRVRYTDKETKPALMVRYLTNAAEAIPILVFFNDGFVEVGNWGPRPNECKRFMARGKAAGKIDEAREKIGAFYKADNHKSTIAEIRALIDIASATGA
ncbi:MAG TPA: thioredoxin family protein [Planctomycetota bacterium]|nr:thioredoxin family protein [Planctomycetota bacterium]